MIPLFGMPLSSRSQAIGFSIALLVATSFAACQSSTSDRQPGLIGVYFSEPDLTAIKARMVLETLEQDWNELAFQTTGSSGIWDGEIIGPLDGELTFHLSTNKVVELRVADKFDATASPNTPDTTLTVTMVAGETYPIHITFYNDGKKDGRDFGRFAIQWSWDGSVPSAIPLASLFHTTEQISIYDFLEEPDPESIDQSQFIRIAAEHKVVYYEEGRFGGWPANAGVWSWGDEILVGFNRAYFKHNPFHHSIDRTKPGSAVLARSLDGGLIWHLEEPHNYSRGSDAIVNLDAPLAFSDPDIAIRNDRENFIASFDRGKTWNGPYAFAGLDMGRLSSRTDYLFNGPNDAFFFLSADDVDSVQAILQDRSFMAHTPDGGQSFEFVSWMADDETVRSVMSSTVRISETHLLTTMRRRYDPAGDFTVMPRNWIDAYESLDNGRTWQFLSKIADTDTGLRNGNPPALVRTDDGLLAVSYGYRGVRYGIRARVSADNGVTWSKEIILRDDAATWDIGYCRSVVRADGKVVSMYYYSTQARPEQHIEATIWDPRLALEL